MVRGRHLASPASRPRRLAALAAAVVLLLPVAAVAVARAPEASASGTPFLPFDLTPTSSPRLVLAHYVPWFPVSFDNAAAAGDTYETAYLDPAGEGGKHAAYGGFLRDRPLGRAVSADPAWRDADVRQEVRDAIAAGLDGFAVDIPNVSPTARSWAAVVRLLRAAHDVDPSFRVLLQPDMVGLARFDSATIAAALAQLAAYPAAMRLGDGRLVVSPYFAEKRTVSWWTDWLATITSAQGVDVALFPVLQDDVTWADDFAPISIGIGNWGSRNPAWNSPKATGPTSPRGRIAAAHARGDLWMQPVAFQDERPRSGLFDEAANTQNLRDTWQVARDGGADWVLLPTWNDYAEGTAIAPSERHGRALLDLVAYYAAWFKRGSVPTLVRDAVYVTHRTQLAAAQPEYPQTRLMALRGGTPARDTVEALAFLTAPATVRVTTGGTTTSCDLPAGVGSCLVALRPGTVSVQVERSSAVVASVTSPYPVDATPHVQDLQYVAVSSLRPGRAPAVPPAAAAATSVPAPAPTTAAPVPAPTSSTVPALLSATTVLTLHLAPGSSTTSPSFQASVFPAASGLVIVWVDGSSVARGWTSASGAVSLQSGALPGGRHSVTATFSPSDTRAYRFSSSSPIVVAVP